MLNERQRLAASCAFGSEFNIQHSTFNIQHFAFRSFAQADRGTAGSRPPTPETVP
jgi:hypothetical protein